MFDYLRGRGPDIHDFRTSGRDVGQRGLGHAMMNATSPGEEPQRAQARQKEISAPAHGDKLRQPGDPAVRPNSLRQAEAVREMICGKRQAVAKQGICFVVHGIELGVDNPGILDELELARDVRIEADETDSARDAVIAPSAPDDAVKPAR